MRLLVTADLHINHHASRPLVPGLIDQMNDAGGDGILLVGDTATADGDELEQCLSRFTTRGPRLFLCGNHELWTKSDDSYALFKTELPRRIAELGWHWLETEPYRARSFAIVGTVGWYDYTFASPRLAIPRRFYETKLSPGAAAYLRRDDLLTDQSDVTPEAMEMVARWNDVRFVKLHRSDEAFLEECLANLGGRLDAVADAPEVLVATHHVPFRELLPPPRFNNYEFSKAYLGSERLGELIARFANVRRLFCGHSHYAARATIRGIEAVNLGSTYRWKTFETVDLPD